MIIDNIKNASKYYGIGPGVTKALKYLQDNDLTAKEPGRYDIDGDNVYALVQKYTSRARSTGVWEAHRRYIDIQFVADGTEQMGYAYIGGMRTVKEYDNDGDYLLLEGRGDMQVCPKGTFAIFAPDDAHMPGIAAGQSQPIIKIVVKVKV